MEARVRGYVAAALVHPAGGVGDGGLEDFNEATLLEGGDGLGREEGGF